MLLTKFVADLSSLIDPQHVVWAWIHGSTHLKAGPDECVQFSGRLAVDISAHSVFGDDYVSRVSYGNYGPVDRDQGRRSFVSGKSK